MESEIKGDYERETGKVIVETFRDLDPNNIPAVLVKSHGPFCWGKSPMDVVNKGIILEEIAFMAYYTKRLNRNIGKIDDSLLDKHFFRKHGENAYYGQK